MGAGVLAVSGSVWLAALSIYDIRARRLPNWLTLPGAVVVLAVAVGADRGAAAVLGAVGLAGLYLVVHLVSPTALGAGDVKLALGVGAMTGCFGWPAWTLSALAASVLTAGWALVALLRRSESTVPHGASMCVAAAVVLVAILADT